MPIYTDKTGRIRVQVEYKGHKKSFSKGIKTQAQAEEVERREQKALVALVDDGVYPDVPITEALARKKSEMTPEAGAKFQYNINSMMPWLADEDATMARIVDVADDMSADMARDGYKIASINIYRAHLRHIARLAYESRAWKRCEVPTVLDQPIWMQIKPLKGGYKPRRVRLSLDEVHAIVAGCEGQVRAFVALAIYTGMRINEVRRIGREFPIDFARQEIIIPPGIQKNRDPGTIPFIEQCPPLPPMEECLQSCPLTVSETTLRRHIRVAATRIGMPEVTPHNLRRTLGSLMLDSNVSIDIIAKTLRNDPQVAYSTYAHESTHVRRAAITAALSRKKIA